MDNHKRTRTAKIIDFENNFPSDHPISTYAPSRLSLQSNFVGREYELGVIEQRLNDPSCHLLTLVGMGGVGKTRLALEAAQRLQVHYAHGVYPVFLQALASPELIITSIAGAVGLQFYSNDEPKYQLLDYFRDKSMLLVMDNLEHLLEGAELLSEILNKVPYIRILATSRERLNLREEWVFEVKGLSYPLIETEPEIESYSALTLFLQHARRTQVDFTLTPTQRPAAIRICRLVGGMPLGIELAAAWARALPCAEIANEIERSLDILETPARNIEPRHRNMRAAFEPTWTRLSDEERDVFMRLSVFRGGFTREAAGEVAAASVRTLTALVDKSLLRIDPNGRYDLHELLRQYGEERLHAASDMAAQISDRHCQYYARFLKRCWPRIIGSQIKEAFADIETEMDNLRVAWNWAIDGCKDAEIEMSLDSLALFYNERGRYQEGQQAFAYAAAAYSKDSANSVIMRAKIQVGGGFYNVLGLSDEGNALLRECIAILRQTDARADLAVALRSLAVLLSDNRLAPDEVGHYLEESLNIFTELNNLWGIAHALNWLSIFHHREFARRAVEGALERAEEYGWQCLAIYEQLDSVWGIAAAHLNLADVAYRRNQFEKCKQYAQKSHDLFRHFGSFWGISMSLMLMGDATIGYKAYDEARRYTAQGLQMPFEFRSPIINFYSLYHLALAIQIWEEEGHLEKAYELIGLLDQHHQKAPLTQKHHFSFRYLSKLEGDLPPRLAAAVERGRLADIETMVKAIIAEFSQSVASEPAALQNQPETLTERELEVLRLIAAGFSNPAIAQKLIISVGTVKAHTSSIYGKLGVNNRVQAITEAKVLGLL